VVHIIFIYYTDSWTTACNINWPYYKPIENWRWILQCAIPSMHQPLRYAACSWPNITFIHETCLHWKQSWL